MGRLEIRIVAVRNIGKIERHGKPDPYVKIKYGDKKAGTRVSYRTRTLQNVETFGTYDEIFKFQVKDPDKDQLRFELMNENVVMDDVIGSYTLSLNGLTRGVVKNYWAILQGTKVSSAELQLDLLAVDFGQDPAPTDKVIKCIEDTKRPTPSAVAAGGAATTTAATFASVHAVQTPYPQAPQGLPQQVTYGAPPPVQPVMPAYAAVPPAVVQPQYYAPPPPPQPQPQPQYYQPMQPPPPPPQPQFYQPPPPPRPQQQYYPPGPPPMQPLYAQPPPMQQPPMVRPGGPQYAYGVPPDM